MDIENITRKRELLLPNDTEFRIHRLTNERIAGRKIVIGEGEVCDHLSHSEFIGCEIRIKSSGRCTHVALINSKFEGCLIWAGKKQVIPKLEADFKGCIFKGKYEVRFWGNVTDCDFSQATLNGVCFKNDNNLGELKCPGYSHVMIKNIESNYEDWNKISKPKEFNRFLVHPKSNGNTVVLNLVDAVDDPDSFWGLIKDKSYVHTIHKKL